MKKLATLVLALILTLGIVSAASAESFYLESAGVTIEVPEGMTGTDQSTDEASILGITVNDNPNLAYAYLVTYIDELEGKWLEDLTEEEAGQLATGFASAIEDPQYGTVEDGDYTLLLVANGDGAQLHYISLLNGWLCDVAVGKSDGVALEESEIQTAAQLLLSITFDGDADEEPVEAEE